MKKQLLALLTVASFSAMAQSSIKVLLHSTGVEVTPNSIVQATVAAEDEVKIEFEIQNISSSTKIYKVKRYDVQLNATETLTAQAYFCFAGRCFGPDVIVAEDSQTLTPNQKSSQIPGDYQMLSADLTEANVVGKSLVKYTFYNLNATSDSVQFSISYNNTPVGIKSTAKQISAVSIVPNPASDNAVLHVQSGVTMNGKVLVYNSLGAVVLEKNVSLAEGNNAIALPTAALPAGVYFCNLSAELGTITKRIIIE